MVGSALFMVVLLTPTIQQLGPDASKFTRTFFKSRRFTITIPLVAVLTTLSGILLFARASGNFDSSWLSSGQGVVLSIGAISGILAAGHGGAVVGPTSSKMMALLDKLGEQGGAPTAEQAAELQALQAKTALHTRISLVLMIIAVVGMASARYV
jgi:hypothetical protein